MKDINVCTVYVSHIALKVHYTLIINKILVAFTFRPLTIVLYTLSCINNIELKRKKPTDLLDDDICATYIYCPQKVGDIGT